MHSLLRTFGNASPLSYPDSIICSHRYLDELLNDMGILLLKVKHGENLAWNDCPESKKNTRITHSTDEWIKTLLNAQIEILSVTIYYPDNAILLCRKLRSYKTTNSGVLRKYALWRLISNFETDKLWKKKNQTT